MIDWLDPWVLVTYLVGAGAAYYVGWVRGRYIGKPDE